MSRLDRRFRFVLIVCALACLPPLAHAQSPAFAGATQPMFRVDPAHTGVSRARFFGGQGGIRWRVQTGSMVRSSPAVTATRVFAGSGDGSLYAIDRASGTVAWKYDAGSPVHSSPAVAGGLVIAATLDGRIFAVDERTGRQRWSLRAGEILPANFHGPIAYEYFLGSPVVAGETVVIGMRDGGVYALDLRSGKQRWRVQTEGRVSGTPAVRDGMVVIGSFDGRVYALDLATGKERWVFRTAGDTMDLQKFGFDRRGIQSSPAIVGDAVYIGSRDGGLYAIDAATGAFRWRATHRGSWVVGSPAVDDSGRVFVGSSDGRFVHAVKAASGEDIWRLTTAGNVQTSPLLIGGALIVGTYRTNDASGELLAIEAATGAVRWRLRMDGSVLSSPAAADGELYVGTDGGSIVAIHEVSSVVPKLAVFYDSLSRMRPYVDGGRLAFEYFRGIGYQPLGPDSLAAWLAARVSDGAPSAVVFANDIIPDEVAPADSASAGRALVRRYLEAGGKVVWLGMPMAGLVRDSTGRPVDFQVARAERLLGFSFASMDGNELPARPTEAGRRWGIDRWLPGRYMMKPDAVSEALTLDEYGLAAAWVKSYRPDRPGSGYVQLWALGANYERLPMIRAVAEYGLLRPAPSP